MTPGRARQGIVAALAVALGLGVVLDAAGQRRASTRKRSAPPMDWLALQVGLDRAGFSPGEIDGRDGRNTRGAAAAYARSQSLEGAQGEPRALLAQFVETAAAVDYVIPAEDASRQWTPRIPPDLTEQGKLTALGYTSLVELISERFHASPTLMKRLNPRAAFEGGATIKVPNVDPMALPPISGPRKEPPSGPRAAQLVVDKATSSLSALDADGRTFLYAPVTTGSEHDPLPIGDWKVLGVFLQPTFFYNPELFWDADQSHAKMEIAPGPNNPVGVAWIDIDKEHYGLHGTPEPSTIGHRASHGCIRLTNWDALRVAASVDKGTAVKFQ